MSYTSPRDDRGRRSQPHMRESFAATIRKEQERIWVTEYREAIEAAIFRLLYRTNRASAEGADVAMGRFFGHLSEQYSDYLAQYLIEVLPTTEADRLARVSPVVNVVYMGGIQ